MQEAEADIMRIDAPGKLKFTRRKQVVRRVQTDEEKIWVDLSRRAIHSTKNAADRKWAHNVHRRRIKLSLNDVKTHFGKPIVKAAQDMGVCVTTLKKLCRMMGVERWPYRPARSPIAVQQPEPRRCSLPPLCAQQEPAPAVVHVFGPDCEIYASCEPMSRPTGEEFLASLMQPLPGEFFDGCDML